MNKISLLAAALLAAAPTLAQAATMQAVFTGVGSDRGATYVGTRNDGVEVRNETVWDEGFFGTPGTITIHYDTDLVELESDSSSSEDGSRYEFMRLSNAITSIEVKSGNDVVFSLGSPGEFSYDSGGSYLDGQRWVTPDSTGDVETFSSQLSGLVEENDGSKVLNRKQYYSSMDFTLYSLFSDFDFETPFSVASLGEDWAGWMNFSLTDTTSFYDGDTYLGYQDATTYYNWHTKSLTVTRLDDTPQPAPVPLPAGAPLVLTGIGAMIGLRRLKRRA